MLLEPFAVTKGVGMGGGGGGVRGLALPVGSSYRELLRTLSYATACDHYTIAIDLHHIANTLVSNTVDQNLKTIHNLNVHVCHVRQFLNLTCMIKSTFYFLLHQQQKNLMTKIAQSSA